MAIPLSAHRRGRLKLWLLEGLHEVPAGPHAVTAWLPPRAGQPARIARGTVTAAGSLAELSLRLAPVP